MIYILYVWTAVAMAGDHHVQVKAMDWRPNGQYETTIESNGRNSGLIKCEAAAQQLGLKADHYRCVKSK